MPTKQQLEGQVQKLRERLADQIETFINDPDTPAYIHLNMPVSDFLVFLREGESAFK